MSDLLGEIGIGITVTDEKAVTGLKRVQKALKDFDAQTKISMVALQSWQSTNLSSMKSLEVGVARSTVDANALIQKARARTAQVSEGYAARVIASMAGVSRASKTESEALVKRDALVAESEAKSAAKRLEIRRRTETEIKAIRDKALLDMSKLDATQASESIRIQEAANAKIKGIYIASLESRKQIKILEKTQILAIEESTQRELLRIDAAAERERDRVIGQRGRNMVAQMKQEQREQEKAEQEAQRARTRRQVVINQVMRSGYAISRGGDIALTGSAVLAAPYVAATIAATQFQTAALKAQNNTDLDAKSVASLTENVRKLMQQGTNNPMDKLFAAGMRAENFRKNGQTAADTFKIMKVASDAATASFSDVEDTTSALAREMYLFNVPIADAPKLMNAMEVAAAHNNLTLEQMVQNSGRLLSLASELKIPLQEQISAYALLTKHGFSASQATTAMSSALRGLISWTPSFKKQVEELAKTHKGLEEVFGVQNVRARGLMGTLRELHDVYHLTQQQILDLFPDYRKNQALVVLLGSGYDELKSGISEVNQAWIENKRYQTNLLAVQKSVGFQTEEIKNKLYLLADSLSKNLLPQLTKLINYINEAINWFNRLSPATKEAAVEWLEVGSAVLFVLGASLKLIGGFAQVVNSLREIREAVIAFRGAMVAAGEAEAATASTGAIAFASGGAWFIAITGAIALVAALIVKWNEVKQAQDDAAQSEQAYQDKLATMRNGTLADKINAQKLDISANRDRWQSVLDKRKEVAAKLSQEGAPQSDIEDVMNGNEHGRMLVSNYSDQKGFGETLATSAGDILGGINDFIKTGKLTQPDASAYSGNTYDEPGFAKGVNSYIILKNIEKMDRDFKALSGSAAALSGASPMATANRIKASDKDVLGQASCAFFASDYLKSLNIEIPRTGSAGDLVTNAKALGAKSVSVASSKPGDLVEWNSPKYGGLIGSTGKRTGHHVGVAIGNGNAIQDDQGNVSVIPIKSMRNPVVYGTSRFIQPNSEYPGLTGYMNNYGGDLDDPLAEDEQDKTKIAGTYNPVEMKSVPPGLSPSIDFTGRGDEYVAAATKAKYAIELSSIESTGNALAVLNAKRKQANDNLYTDQKNAEIEAVKLNDALSKQNAAYAKLSAATDNYNSIASHLNDLLAKRQQMQESGSSKSELSAINARIQASKSLLAVSEGGTRQHPETSLKYLTEQAALAKAEVVKFGSAMVQADNSAGRMSNQIVSLDSAIERMQRRLMQDTLTKYRNSGIGGVLSLQDEISNLTQQTLSGGNDGTKGLNSIGIVPAEMLQRGDLKEIAGYLQNADMSVGSIKDQYDNLLKVIARIQEIKDKIASHQATSSTRSMADVFGNKDMSIPGKQSAITGIMSQFGSDNGISFDPTMSESDAVSAFQGQGDKAIALVRAYYADMRNLSDLDKKRKDKDEVDNNAIEVRSLVRKSRLQLMDRDAFLQAIHDKSAAIAGSSLGDVPPGMTQGQMVKAMQDKVTSDVSAGTDASADIARRNTILANIKATEAEEDHWKREDEKKAKEWEQTWKDATEHIKTTMVDGFTNIITDSKSRTKDMHKLWDDLFKDILKMIIKKFVTDALAELNQVFKKKPNTGADTTGAGDWSSTGGASPAAAAKDTANAVKETAKNTAKIANATVASGSSGTANSIVEGANVANAAVGIAGAHGLKQDASAAMGLLNSVPKGQILKTLGSSVGGALTSAMPYVAAALAVASLIGVFGSGKKTPSSSRDEEFHPVAGAISSSVDSGYSGQSGMRSIIGSILASQAGVRLSASGGLKGAQQPIQINNPQFHAHGVQDTGDFMKQSMDSLEKELHRRATLRNAALGEA